MIFENDKINEIYQNRKMEFELKLSKDIKKILLHKYFVLDYECESAYSSSKILRIKGLITNVEIFEDSINTTDSYGCSQIVKTIKLNFGFVDSTNGENVILYLKKENIKLLIYGTDRASTFLEAECSETSYDYEESEGKIIWN